MELARHGNLASKHRQQQALLLLLPCSGYALLSSPVYSDGCLLMNLLWCTMLPLSSPQTAGVSPKVAKTIGICVDHRRVNKSTESLDANVARLQEYMSKLVVFPRGSKVKQGDATKADAKAVPQLKGEILPIVSKPQVEFVKITDEMKAQRAYHVLRLEHNNAKMEGRRIKRAKDAEEAKK